MSLGDALSIATAFLVLLLTLIFSLVAYIFKDIREDIKVNGKHLDSVITSLWNLNWKVNHIEEFLQRKYNYHPLTDFPPEIR